MNACAALSGADGKWVLVRPKPYLVVQGGGVTCTDHPRTSLYYGSGISRSTARRIPSNPHSRSRLWASRARGPSQKLR